MRLGFDIDGTVCNTAQALVDCMNTKYGLKYTVEIFKNRDLSKNHYINSSIVNNIIVKYLSENVLHNKKVLLNLKPYDGAVKFLNQLKRRGHLLFFITSRSNEYEDVTARWLRSNGINFDGLVTVGADTKGRYGRMLNLDFYMDDYVDNLEDMYLYKQRWYKGLALFTRPWNIDVILNPERYIRLDGWLDLMRHLGIAKRNDKIYHV